MKTKLKISQKLIDGIDFIPLQKELKHVLDIDIQFQIDVYERRLMNGETVKRLALHSHDITHHLGAMQVAVAECRIENFGGGITEEGDELWLPIHFAYEMKGGGSNGMHILYAYYSFVTKRWRFKLMPSNKKKAPVVKVNVMVQADRAITAVFSDTSVSKEETIDRLEQLNEMIDDKLATLVGS